MRAQKSSVLLLILTLLTFMLYVYQLDGQSLRGDEAFDAVFIKQPVSELLAELRAIQPYPPLYHIALLVWTGLAGNSVFALRFLSVMCMTLVVPLAYQLGRLWFGRRAGRWTAMLAAMQPLYYWYAQDRLYALLIVATFGLTITATRIWQGYRTKALWLGQMILTLLSLSVHYVAIFTVVAQNLIALLLGVRRHGLRWYGYWLSTQLTAGLVFLPWIIFAWPILTSHTSDWTKPVTLFEMLWRLLRGYSVGLTITPTQATLPILAFGIAALLGLFAPGPPSDRPTRLIAVTLIGIPIAGVFGLSLRQPMFDERYLIFLIAPYLALLGRGLASLSRWHWAQAILALVMLAGMSIANLNYRFNPDYVKAPDWKATFAYLQAHAQQGDAIVYTYPDPAPIYYAADRWPTILLPPRVPIDENEVRRIAGEVAAQHQQIWLIPQWISNWDQKRFTEQVLDGLAERTAELRTGSLPLVQYHTRERYLAERVPLDAILGDGIRLAGATLRTTDGAPTQSLAVRPGASVRITLYWQALQKPAAAYSVFVQLLDAGGQVRGQADAWPRGGAYPTSWWEPGNDVVDTYVIDLNPSTPAGQYTLIAGMHTATGVRLPVSGTNSDANNGFITIPVTIQVQ